MKSNLHSVCLLLMSNLLLTGCCIRLWCWRLNYLSFWWFRRWLPVLFRRDRIGSSPLCSNWRRFVGRGSWWIRCWLVLILFGLGVELLLWLTQLFSVGRLKKNIINLREKKRSYERFPWKKTSFLLVISLNNFLFSMYNLIAVKIIN